MGLYDAFQTDPDLEAGEGVTINYGADIGKITIHRAGIGNQRFVKRQQALVKPFQRQIDNDTLPPEKSRELNIQLYAETVVVGWEGITGPDGEALPFSVENVKRVLTDLPDVYSSIVQEANNRTNFLRRTQAEAAGN